MRGGNVSGGEGRGGEGSYMYLESYRDKLPRELSR